MLKILLFIYLIFVSVVDISKKEIPFWSSVICILAVSVTRILYFEIPVVFLLHGMFTGMMLLIISYITKGAIGMGDGILFLVIGSVLGFADTLTVLAGSLLLSSIMAAVLFIFCHVGKRHQIPFAPFVCFTYGGMMFFG